jgi:hypothetical protein
MKIMFGELLNFCSKTFYFNPFNDNVTLDTTVERNGGLIVKEITQFATPCVPTLSQTLHNRVAIIISQCHHQHHHRRHCCLSLMEERTKFMREIRKKYYHYSTIQRYALVIPLYFSVNCKILKKYLLVLLFYSKQVVNFLKYRCSLNENVEIFMLGQMLRRMERILVIFSWLLCLNIILRIIIRSRVKKIVGKTFFTKKFSLKHVKQPPKVLEHENF